MRAWFRASLRRRLMALVIFGAILTMAVVGWWLTQSAVRSAEDRLRAELDSTLAGIGAGIERRWETRRGDLLLIAGNEVVARTGAHHAPRFTIRVSVAKLGEATAEGTSKQEAETAAAEALLAQLQ